MRKDASRRRREGGEPLAVGERFGDVDAPDRVEPSRSARVRATFSTRWKPRAESAIASAASRTSRRPASSGRAIVSRRSPSASELSRT